MLLLVKQHKIRFIKLYINKENTISVLLFRKGYLYRSPIRLSDSEIKHQTENLNAAT